jgi:hypothetical protein
MPGLSKLEAVDLSKVQVREHIVPPSKVMQDWEFLFWYRIAGDCLRLPRVAAANNQPDPNLVIEGTVDEGKAVPDSPSDCSEVKLLLQEVFARTYCQAIYSSVMDQANEQIRACSLRMDWKASDTMYNGDPVARPEEYGGLDYQLSPSNILMPNDTTNYYATLEDFARLAVKPRSPDGRGAHVLVMNRTGYNNFVQALISAGVALQYVQREVWDENEYFAVRNVPHAFGMAVLVNEFVKSNKRLGTFSDATSAYAFTVGRGGAYFITSSEEGKPVKEVRTQADSTTPLEFHRLAWSIGFVLESQGAAARLDFRTKPGTAA